MSEANAADGAGAAPATTDHDPNKIDVVLKFVGDTPIMRKTKWAVEKHKTVCSLVNFIHKYLKCESNETIFVYVNQCFAPPPDTTIGMLYDCYGSEGKLILNYSKSEAWG